MTTNYSVDSKSLAEKAKNSKDKEAYKLIKKEPSYRIGVGSRINSSDNTTFFVEVVINLSKGNDKVDVTHLEKTKTCLNALQSRNYTLTYEEGNSITCETTKTAEELAEECHEVKSKMKQLFGSER